MFAGILLIIPGIPLLLHSGALTVGEFLLVIGMVSALLAVAYGIPRLVGWVIAASLSYRHSPYGVGAFIFSQPGVQQHGLLHQYLVAAACVGIGSLFVNRLGAVIKEPVPKLWVLFVA